jgi:hypothetical protein
MMSPMFFGQSYYCWMEVDHWGSWSWSAKGGRWQWLLSQWFTSVVFWVAIRGEEDGGKREEKERERRRVMKLEILVFYWLDLFSNEIIDDISIGKSNMSIITNCKLNI